MSESGDWLYSNLILFESKRNECFVWTKELFGQNQNIKIIVFSIIGIALGMSIIFMEGWRMPIFLLIMVTVVAMIFWEPYVGVVFFTFLLYFSPEDHGVGSAARVSLYVSLLTLVAWLIKGIGEKKLNIKWPLQLVILGILSLWMFIVTQTAHISVEASLADSIKFFKIFVFCFLIIAIANSQKKLKILLAINIFGITYFSLNGFHSLLFGGDVNGIYSDNNSLAHLLDLFFPLGIAMLFYPTKWVRFWGYGLILMQLSTIIISNSRGGMLGLTSMLLWMLFQGLRELRWKMIGIIGIIVILAAGIIFGTEAGGRCIKRMETIKTYQKDEGSAMKRIYLWQAGIEMIKDHPIVGVGMDNFALTFPEYNPYLKPQTSHSTYIQFGSECGIPGLGIYLLLLIFHFKTTFDIRRKVDKNSFEAYVCLSLESGIIGHMISSIFIAKVYSEPVYWIIMFGAILKNLVKEQINLKSASK
ncbi:MAG: O-antigen ligase family protein [bacterium]|nr:O-antigen ligase family protein [bacterium]